MTNKFSNPDDYQFFNQNDVTFITFNYDRSLEFFLFDSFTNSFYDAKRHGSTNKILYDTLRKISIFHVYGAITELFWQFDQRQRERKQDTYRFQYNLQDIMNMIENIRVIGERSSSKIEEIKISLSDAERIFFLGFGFANENMEILGIPEIFNENQKIYGTAYGWTEREINKLFKIFLSNPLLDIPSLRSLKKRSNLRFLDCDCLTLLRNFL